MYSHDLSHYLTRPPPALALIKRNRGASARVESTDESSVSVVQKKTNACLLSVAVTPSGVVDLANSQSPKQYRISAAVQRVCAAPRLAARAQLPKRQFELFFERQSRGVVLSSL